MIDARLVLRKVHENLAECMREMTRRSRAGTILENGGVLLYASAHEAPGLFNGAIRISQHAEARELLTRARAFFGPRRRGYTVWALEGPDDDLAEAAAAEGLVHATTGPEMVLTRPIAERPLPVDVSVRMVETESDLRAMHDVLREGFGTIGVPGDVWQAVWPDVDSVHAEHITTALAFWRGRPAATAMAVLGRSVGQLLNVSTIPEARRQSLGEIVSRTVTNAAFERGVAAVSLQATPDGEPLYARMGYEEIGRYRWYVKMTPGGQ